MTMKDRATILLACSLMVVPAAAMSQHVFFSSGYGNCWDPCEWNNEDYYIYIRAPQIDDAVGASFRFESTYFGPEDFTAVFPLQLPMGGVTIESGDLFSGITLSWPAGNYWSEQVLAIKYAPAPPSGTSGWQRGTIRDARLFLASGDTLELDDVDYNCAWGECFGGCDVLTWLHPDTVAVPIGAQVNLRLRYIENSHSGGPTGTLIDATDELGWITGCPNCWIECNYCYFDMCPWNRQAITLEVSVPPAVEPGTVCRVDISGNIFNETSVYLVADPPVSVEKKTIGGVKSLFKRK